MFVVENEENRKLKFFFSKIWPSSSGLKKKIKKKKIRGMVGKAREGLMG